mgnify:FL=1|tara:strand:- start:2842 stop:3480 length:639 start_codon:yes stop_codon:yes gene_type:complete
MNYDDLYILGSGGHGKVVAEVAIKNKIFKKIYFLDDNYKQNTKVYNTKVAGDLSENFLKKIDKKKSAFITAFGDGKLRSKFHIILKKLQLPIISLIDESSFVSSTSKINSGSLICAGSVIGPETEIGEGVIINHNSSVDHDCIIGSFVHICPGVNLAGNVEVDKFSHVGIGSSVIQGIRIGKECIVGAGSVVIKDIKNKNKVAGNPAKKLNF